jgi:predicted phage terminase large subunit-like protein
MSEDAEEPIVDIDNHESPSDEIGEEERAKEVADRLRAGKYEFMRCDLINFVADMKIPGVPLLSEPRESEDPFDRSVDFAKHHFVWLEMLQQVEDGSLKRLMGLMPPGSAKSTYTSVVFPVHVMGRFKDTQVLVASYGSGLPRKWGRKARSVVRQPRYRAVFGAELTKEASAAESFALTNGSEYMGAGILSGITGNRADGIVWDDLIKGRDQADSALIRQKTWDAYIDDLLTRKKPNAWEIGITTRWHEDDIAGRILPEGYNGESGLIQCRDGNEWYVVCIPAEAEREGDLLDRQIGERIWPEWFPPDHFAQFKRIPRTWTALYQQRPAPEQGSYFKAEWLRTIEKVPPREHLRVYGGSDYAVTAGGGDYTVHVVVGLDADGRMYLLDLWRRQSASNEWVESFCDLVLQWKPIGWAEEPGQIKSGVGPFLDRRIRERRAFVARESFPAHGDKGVRAQSMRGRMAMEGLYLPAGAPWLADFRSELLSFPAGRHDDQVDAMGLVGQLLDKMVPPAPPKRPGGSPRDRWEGPDDNGPNWKTV